MSVRQEVIPGLHNREAHFMIILPKRLLSTISRGKGEKEKKGEIKK